MHNSQRLVKGPPRCTLLIHPDDAARRGIASASLSDVASRVGRISLVVEVTDEVMPGVVSIPHGWGHDRSGIRLGIASTHAGVSVNDLTDEQSHPAEDCFRAVGYRLDRPQPMADDYGERWTCFVARREGRRVRVCERIHDGGEGQWTDTSAWFWAAQYGGGP